MTSPKQPGSTFLEIELEPELSRHIEAAAAQRGVSLRDYVVIALREAVEHANSLHLTPSSRDWSQLSDRAFARDWESEADAVYDDLA
jgi:hypothetical protein